MLAIYQIGYGSLTRRNTVGQLLNQLWLPIWLPVSLVIGRAQFNIEEQRSQNVWQLRLGCTITPGCSKEASRHVLQLPLSIITFGTWLDNRIALLWGDSHLRQHYSIPSTYGNELIRMCPYNGIWRGFLGMQCRWFYLVTEILRIHRATGGWTIWALSGDQQIQHVFKVHGGSIDVSYLHVGMDGIWLSDSPNWVWHMWFADWAYSYNWWKLWLTHCVSWTQGLPCCKSKNPNVDLQCIRPLAL